MADKLPVEFSWVPDGVTGWGLLGIHIALGLARCGRPVHVPSNADLSTIPATLVPAIQQLMAVGNPAEERIYLYANSNRHDACPALSHRLPISLAMFEDSLVTPEAVQRLRTFPLHIAPSRWEQARLSAVGIEAPVWHQGFDETLFVPSGRRRPAHGPFLIFSGGKLEFRKGQDIVLESFKRFRKTPEGKDALLVTAWQNKWVATMEGIWAKGYVRGVPTLRMGQLDMRSWVEANGIDGTRVLDVGVQSQAAMASIVRECDVAIFPNRCEAATNMPIVETMGCGVPVIATNATGHADVFWKQGGPTDGMVALTRNGTVPPQRLYKSTETWFEADPDEIVEGLKAIRNRPQTPPNPKDVLGWTVATEALDRLLSELAG